MIWACSGINRYPEPIEFLIGNGAKVDVQNNIRETALFTCLNSESNMGHDKIKEIVQLLLSAGADPGIRDLRGLNARDVAFLNGREYAFVIE